MMTVYAPLGDDWEIQKFIDRNEFPYYFSDVWRLSTLTIVCLCKPCEDVTDAVIEGSRPKKDLHSMCGDRVTYVSWKNPPHLKSLLDIELRNCSSWSMSVQRVVDWKWEATENWQLCMGVRSTCSRGSETVHAARSTCRIVDETWNASGICKRCLGMWWPRDQGSNKISKNIARESPRTIILQPLCHSNLEQVCRRFKI